MLVPQSKLWQKVCLWGKAVFPLGRNFGNSLPPPGMLPHAVITALCPGLEEKWEGCQARVSLSQMAAPYGVWHRPPCLFLDMGT